MNVIIYAVIMSALWIVNLLNDTGLGAAYGTTQKARVVIYVIFAILCLLNFVKNRIRTKKYDFLLYFSLFFYFTFVSFVFDYKKEGIHYLISFILIYLLRHIQVTEKMLKITGVLYLFMGMGVLFIYDFGSVLSSWNPNTIAMIGLYSYLFFLIPYLGVNKLNTKVIIILVTVVYMFLVSPTNSRSCNWFALLFLLFALRILPHKIITKSSKRYVIWLLIPLIIAIFVIQISRTSFFTKLDNWSINNFNKTIFNGREILWNYCFRFIANHLLFGSGTFVGNWHNCFLTILMGYGVIGALLWLLSIKRILLIGQKHISDSLVVGCILAFIIIYFQQSVELGLISENPNLIPYIILGVLLGRVNYLNNHNRLSEKNDKN